MVFRSLLLSVAVTGFLVYSLTVGLTDPQSFLKKIPEWLGIPLLMGGGLLYLLAAWWAIKGFSSHKIMALGSMGFCVLGLGFYALMIIMELGHGKARPGQYSYDFTTLDAAEMTTLKQIAQDAGLPLQSAVFTEHWHLNDSTAPFKICLQKGHITALRVSDHAVHNLALYSRLPALGELYLNNCGLSDLSGLRLAQLDRFDARDNKITDLKTLRGCPNLQWLLLPNNRLKSTEGLDHFKRLVSTDFTENPLP